MRRSIVIALAAALLFAACDGNEDGDLTAGGAPQASATSSPPDSTAPPDAPDFTPATILIDGAEQGPVLLQGEVADTPEARAYGLMGRESLPNDYGMAFILFEETDCCFWMYRTKVALSIAFFDQEGRIVDMTDMEPCTSTSRTGCEFYGSDEPYIGALEVRQGLFEEWGVTEGDRIRIVQ